MRLPTGKFSIIIFIVAFFFNLLNAQAQKVYTVDATYKADIKVFVVSSAYQADLKIYFVSSAYQAGWKKVSKKYLLY